MHGAWKDGDQDLLRGPAELDLLASEVLALGSLNQVESVDVDTLLLSEALRGACRRADGIVGHRFGRTGYFDLDVSLFREQAANPGGQAARRAEGLHRYPIKETLGGEQLLDIRTEFLFCFRKHPGGNLLAANFKEEFDSLFDWGPLHARTSRWDAPPPICDR